MSDPHQYFSSFSFILYLPLSVHWWATSHPQSHFPSGSGSCLETSCYTWMRATAKRNRWGFTDVCVSVWGSVSNWAFDQDFAVKPQKGPYSRGLCSPSDWLVLQLTSSSSSNSNSSHSCPGYRSFLDLTAIIIKNNTGIFRVNFGEYKLIKPDRDNGQIQNDVNLLLKISNQSSQWSVKICCL